ncbi:MAG: MBOAT family protein, partial [Myxococcales bacterium]
MTLSIQELGDWTAFPVTAALCGASGAINGPSASRRALAAVLVALTLFTPWLASTGSPVTRFLCACGGVLAVFRNLDLYRDRNDWGPIRRGAHVLSAIDSRSFERLRPFIDRAAWARVVGFGLLTAITASLLRRGALYSSAAGDCPIRWFIGAIWAYCSAETLLAVLLASFHLGGVGVPRLHDNPILSRTLREFWGCRWNLVVHRMLLEHCFRPLMRRTNVSGAVLGAFVASAALHFWVTLAAAGFGMAASMATFFLIQAMLVIIEQHARVQRWHPVLQHVWSVSC